MTARDVLPPASMKANLLLIAMVVSACATSQPADDDAPGQDGEVGAPLGDHQAPRFTGTDPADADGDGIADELEDYLLAQFYAYNDSVGGVNHEADWEHATISVTSDLDVVSVYYSAHHEGGRLDDLAKLSWRDRTHPVGYSADGSHAVYETAGEHPSAVPGFPDHAYDGGPIWETWNNVANLGERGKILHDQGWARYDGRWGEVGNVEDTSGPVGPMYSGRWLAKGSEY